MTITAITLLIFSAFIHAGWNLLSKRQHSSAGFFLTAVASSILVQIPVVLWFRATIALIPETVWIILLATGFCQAVYFTALAAAYRNGDMSIAYPIARSSPVIVVTFAAFVLGRAREIGPFCVIGVVMIVVGGFLLPMRHYHEVRLRNYLNLTCVFALVAAFATAGYSMLDDQGLRIMRQTPLQAFSPMRAALVFSFFEGVSTCFWLGIFVLLRPSSLQMLLCTLRESKTTAVFVGLGSYLAYLLVLISMAFVSNVSYVVAFRQLSIPIGVMLGVLLLKEPRNLPKLLGTLVMFGGLLLVAFG